MAEYRPTPTLHRPLRVTEQALHSCMQLISRCDPRSLPLRNETPLRTSRPAARLGPASVTAQIGSTKSLAPRDHISCTSKRDGCETGPVTSARWMRPAAITRTGGSISPDDAPSRRCRNETLARLTSAGWPDQIGRAKIPLRDTQSHTHRNKAISR